MQIKTLAKKRFGQNFLQDKNIIHKIIASIAPQATDHIVEIGPGLGALTTQILPQVSRLDAVELDRDLIPKLEAACGKPGNLYIYQANALKFDFSNLSAENKPLRIVGNLPYNISTPIIFHLLKYLPLIENMHFMLQQEVVERLAAKPGNKIYGRLSVMVQYFCEVTKLFTVPPQAFYPAPKVYSAIVRLKPHKEIALPAQNINYFTNIVKQAFSQRRKTIHNSLKSHLSNEQLQSINIDPKSRPEQLTVADFVKISNIG
ncbi:MAG: 16S rRNA (adenine(1518)-N(6)/adenine(1519)-N(6))-dimethyltransferase RsmA [Gammaproteobacteria bacterium]|nr:16S rRNA (adenine(1518)-N(6)/adenine(1519)-N(6))-dimethyltransferase RsmA [Gammaproteobacteria bacterium]